jgi:hypothetical protein
MLGYEKRKRREKKPGLWKLTPLMGIRLQRGFPPRLGKHKALPTVSTRPYGGCISLWSTQNLARSETKKGDILIEVRKGTFLNLFDIA